MVGDDLLSSDAVIVGSPVYVGNMRNKIGAAFATGASVSNGKEVAMLTVLGAMLIHQMIVISGGGGFGASATTGPDSPGIDAKEIAEARDLGKRVAEVAALVKRGSSK